MTTTVQGVILDLFKKDPHEHEDVVISERTGIPQSICIMALTGLVSEGVLRRIVKHDVFTGTFYALRQPKYDHIRELAKTHGDCLKNLPGGDSVSPAERHMAFAEAIKSGPDSWAKNHKKRGTT